MESLVDVLKMGATVKGTNWCGFTEGQLEKMSVTKAFLRKMVKKGVIKHGYVRTSPRGGQENFYYVEHDRPELMLEKDGKELPKVAPEATTISLTREEAEQMARDLFAKMPDGPEKDKLMAEFNDKKPAAPVEQEPTGAAADVCAPTT